MLKNRPTSRVGTIEDSYYSIKNRIDMLEDEGKIRVKTFGESPDGKVTNEFHIYPNNRMDSFTVSREHKIGICLIIVCSEGRFSCFKGRVLSR